MSSRSLNRVQLIGNLTRDVELRYTSSGTPIATFTVATNRSYTDSSGNQTESAEFTNVVAWAKLGELCAQLLKKGTKVFIEGRLQTSSWQDKETGKTMRKTEAVASEMIVLNGGGPSSTGADNPASVQTNSATPKESDMNENVAVSDDDLSVDFDQVKEEESESDDSKDKKAE